MMSRSNMHSFKENILEHDMNGKRELSLDYSNSGMEWHHSTPQYQSTDAMEFDTSILQQFQSNFQALESIVLDQVPSCVKQIITELIDRIQGYAKHFSSTIRERNELMKGIRTQIKVYGHQTSIIISQYNAIKQQRDELEAKLAMANRQIEEFERTVTSLRLAQTAQLIQLEVKQVLDITIERVQMEQLTSELTRLRCENQGLLQHIAEQDIEQCKLRGSFSEKGKPRLVGGGSTGTASQFNNSQSFYHNRHSSHQIDSNYSDHHILKGFGKVGRNQPRQRKLEHLQQRQSAPSREGTASKQVWPQIAKPPLPTQASIDAGYKSNSSKSGAEQSRSVTPKRTQNLYFPQNEHQKYKSIRRHQEQIKRSINQFTDELAKQGRHPTAKEEQSLSQIYQKYASIKEEGDKLEQSMKERSQCHSTEKVMHREVAVQVEFTKLDLQEKDARIHELGAELKKRQLLNNELNSKLKERTSQCAAARVEYDGAMRRLSELQAQEESMLLQKLKEIKSLSNQLEDMKGKVRVVCRVRPLLKSERDQQGQAIIQVTDCMTLQVSAKQARKSFRFDSCFGDQSTQAEIFTDLSNLVRQAFDGYNICIFAYGQTGSGKTYTMYGDHENPGIIPRVADELFSLIAQHANSTDCQVFTYITELYKDQLMDLLGSKGQLEIREDVKGFTYIHNITTVKISSKIDLLESIEYAASCRKTSTTDMNEKSSRSHFIVTICLETHCRTTNKRTVNKICLIDLAGSERAHKSNPNAGQLLEAKSINKSLTALGDVIAVLSGSNAETQHVPYRNNKLTHLMKDSLGGNSKTVMIINLSPCDSNLEESQIALMYGQRVKRIKNEPIKNLESFELSKLKDTCKKLSEENNQLKSELQQRHKQDQLCLPLQQSNRQV